MMICLVFIKTNKQTKKKEKSSTSLQNKHQFNLPNIVRLFTVHFLEADPNTKLSEHTCPVSPVCDHHHDIPSWYNWESCRIHFFIFFFYLLHIATKLCTKPSQMRETDQLRIFLSHYYRFSSDVFCTISLIILELIFHLLYCTAIEKIYKNKTEVIAFMV